MEWYHHIVLTMNFKLVSFFYIYVIYCWLYLCRLCFLRLRLACFMCASVFLSRLCTACIVYVCLSVCLRLSLLLWVCLTGNQRIDWIPRALKRNSACHVPSHSSSRTSTCVGHCLNRTRILRWVFDDVWRSFSVVFYRPTQWTFIYLFYFLFYLL